MVADCEVDESAVPVLTESPDRAPHRTLRDNDLVMNTVPVPRSLLLWLFACGTLAPALFDAVYLVEGATRPGYDAWRQAISTLMEGLGGWVQQADFVVLGLFTLGVAVVWRRILEGGVCATWYPVIRGIEGLSLVVIGFSLTDPLHTLWLFMMIGARMAGLFVIARGFWREPNWRGWVVYSIVSAVLINVFIALFGVLQHTPFAAGVLERVATNIEPFWSLIVFARLWNRVPFMVDRLSPAPAARSRSGTQA